MRTCCILAYAMQLPGVRPLLEGGVGMQGHQRMAELSVQHAAHMFV